MVVTPDRSSQILTFLYTDIEGSTRLWEQFPQAMESALSRHDKILHASVEGHGGSVFRTTGDGLCAVFANASNGLAAALDAQLALQAEPWDEIGQLCVRMAIHTGEAEKYGGDYSGSSLNRIGRLLGLTHGGQTLLSQASHLLVRHALPQGARLLDLGEIRMRDLSYPEHVFQLVHPDLPDDFPPLASHDRRPNNLPAQPTPLVGRQVELKEILARLKSPNVRLLTLIGPGGTGKTRLGLQVASDLVDSFANGVFFVDLASIRNPEAIPSIIARTLGIRETSYHPVLEELKERLHEQEMLLLLDNFEQVTEAAPYVVELLQDSPLLKVLVTSREALRVRVEHVFPVPPLALPASGLKHPSAEQLSEFPAVRLFVERAQAVRPDFILTEENAPAVAEICIRLDGLPLAIELAASRIRLFSPQALLDRLGSRLQMLKGGARDLPTRHQTLRGTIAWSYELLEPAGQCMFELVSVFSGGATIESIETVAGMVDRLEEMGVDPIDNLASLVDKSLVRQVDVPGSEPRYMMLETIREYAAERLGANSGFQADALWTHAAYFADFAQRQWGRLTEDSSETPMTEMEAEIENVRTAWRYWVAQEDFEQLSKFTDCLRFIYDARGWYHAMIDLTTDLLNVLSKAPSTPERARQEIILQTNLASALLITKGYVSGEIEQAYNRARQLIEEQGEVPQLFPVLSGLARYYTYRGEYEKAAAIGQQVLNLAEQLDDADMRVAGHLVLGSTITFYTSLKEGLDHLEQGIANYDPNRRSLRRFRFGSDSGIACYITSALNLWMLGYPDKAISRMNDTVNLALSLKHPFSIAYAVFHTGLLYLWTKQIEPAEQKARVLRNLADEYDFDIWKAVSSCLHGATLVGLGQEDLGVNLIQWGMKTYLGLKTPPVFWSLLLFNQAEAYLRAGKPEQGLAALNEAMEPEEPAGEGALLAEFFRLRGDLLRAISSENDPEAERMFLSAIQVAKGQQAKMLALRAALSLAKLWRDQGMVNQSRQLLQEYYQEMTEGNELADVQEARTLLEGF
jgi:predicted ATPase/class 3 adenylate cyclase